MEIIVSDFIKLLSDRFTYNDIHTTEDTVRYTFFASMIRNSYYQPHEIILEYPHPNLPNKEVDTYIPSINGKHGLVIEFKYDRSSLSNSPRTMKAGKLVNDLFRLGLFNTDSSARKWLIYLTDNEMASYFSNSKNGLVDFFNLDVNEILHVNNEYIMKKAKTFNTAINTYSQSLNIKCICKVELPKNHKLRIYEII